MKIIDQLPFEFYGSTFELYYTDERKLLLPLRNLCESLELDFSSQLRRIKDDEGLEDILYTVRAPVVQKNGAAQEREITCISLQRLPYWLGSVDTKRVKPELKEKVIRFKRQLADVAWAAFRSQILPEDMLAEFDATLPPAEKEYNKLMDQAAALLQQVGVHGDRLGKVEDRVAALEARLVGTDFINHVQARQYLDAVGILGDMLKERKSKMASPYAVIHNSIKQEFGVPSYQLIPENQFSDVMNYLAKWWKREAAGMELPQIFTVRQDRLL